MYWLPTEQAHGHDLYLNITNRCSNNCYFCLRKFRNGVGGFNLKLRKEPTSSQVVTELQKIINRRPWHEIVFCGFGEPLERLDCILEVAGWVKKYPGHTVRVDTNGQGYLLNKRRDVVKELKDTGIDNVSVSVNAHDEATYDQVCKPTFNDAFDNVLEFVRKAKKAQLDTEITAVALPEIDIPKVKAIADAVGVGFRVRQYVPGFW